jgi:hypothetical protein
MGRLVYLLWEHEEHGPTDLVATDDSAEVLPLLKERLYWPDPKHERAFAKATAENEQAEQKAKIALEANEPCTTRLFEGWGGTHLQIVELASRVSR